MASFLLDVTSHRLALDSCVFSQALNWMYQTSLAQFLQWFDASLKDSTKDRTPQRRVNNIIDYMTFCVYRNIMRSLFERDKVTYKVNALSFFWIFCLPWLPLTSSDFLGFVLICSDLMGLPFNRNFF